MRYVSSIQHWIDLINFGLKPTFVLNVSSVTISAY